MSHNAYSLLSAYFSISPLFQVITVNYSLFLRRYPPAPLFIISYFFSHTNFLHLAFRFASIKRALENTTSKNVFVKDMGSSITEGYHQYLPKGYKHTFLIRNPTHSIFSYRKAMYKHFSQLGLLQGEAADEKTYDVERDERYIPPGFFTKELYDLWVYVKANLDSNPVIIDADELLTHPKEVLSAYCNAVGLPYHDGAPEVGCLDGGAWQDEGIRGQCAGDPGEFLRHGDEEQRIHAALQAATT